MHSALLYPVLLWTCCSLFVRATQNITVDDRFVSPSIAMTVIAHMYFCSDTTALEFLSVLNTLECFQIKIDNSTQAF